MQDIGAILPIVDFQIKKSLFLKVKKRISFPL